jgi:hypothetical protein
VTGFDTLMGAVREGTAGGTVRRWAADRLDAIVAGRLAARAVRHPLGFLCLPVERTGERGVCVHVWGAGRPTVRPSTSAMHAHSWDLTSYVLYGAVRNQVLAVTDAGAGATNRLFEVASAGDADEIRDTRRLVRYRAERTTLHRGGDVYTLPAGVFHTTMVHGEAATIALGSGRPGAADLSLGGIDTPPHRVHRQRCDPAETSRIARAVARRLADPATPSDATHREETCVSRRP